MMRALAVIVLVTACGDSKPAPPAANAAGTVIEVSGSVSVAGKPIKRGDTIAATDTIDTGPDGRVVIELAHNKVRVDLGPNKHVRLEQSVAWSQPMKVDAPEQDGVTTSAGRPVERNAAGTTSTTSVDERAPDPAADSPPPPPPPVKEEAPPMDSVRQETSKGLGLSGTGEGGGGMGTGTGISSIGTIGMIDRGGSAGDSTYADSISAVVKQHAKDVRLCYQRVLAAKPTLEGKVVVAFTIGADGKVTAAESAKMTTMPDAGVVQCVVRQVRSWQFPVPPDGPAKVTFPFLFNRGG